MNETCKFKFYIKLARSSLKHTLLHSSQCLPKPKETTTEWNIIGFEAFPSHQTEFSIWEIHSNLGDHCPSILSTPPNPVRLTLVSPKEVAFPGTLHLSFYCFADGWATLKKLNAFYFCERR